MAGARPCPRATQAASPERTYCAFSRGPTHSLWLTSRQTGTPIERRTCAGAGVRWRTGVAAATLVVWSCHQEIVFDDLATCASDRECVLPSLHCSDSRCVACLDDAHCTNPLRPRCDLALLHCVECGVAADCPVDAACRRGHCAVACGTGCPSSAPKCEDGLCVECDDGAGCVGSPAGAVCVDNVCAGCATAADCRGAARVCDPVRHQCVECQQHTDCPIARPLCDPDSAVCVATP